MKHGTGSTAAAEPTGAAQQYAQALVAHFTNRDMRGALELYRGVMVDYPSSPEAELSRTQLEHIVDSVVPSEGPLESRVQLALAQLARDPLGVSTLRLPPRLQRWFKQD